MNSQNPNKNFKVFSGIRSFTKLDDGYISVTDVETNYSIVEDYKVVYDILKIILTEQRFDVFVREVSAGNSVVYNFLTNKLSFVRDKEEELMKSALSKELKHSVIESRYLDGDEKKEFFLN